jgi:hypothetical protein
MSTPSKKEVEERSLLLSFLCRDKRLPLEIPDVLLSIKEI